MLLIRSANSAVAISMPTIAAVIAFVTYSLTGHPLDPAIIFTALTLFNLLRMPLMMLRTFSKSYISNPSLISVQPSLWVLSQMPRMQRNG
jgi:hypothetical protein